VIYLAIAVSLLQCMSVIGQQPCPIGWDPMPAITTRGRQCTRFLNSSRTWLQAEADCQGLCIRDCHLVSIPNAINNAKISEYGQFMWIGLSTSDSTSTAYNFNWTDGSNWPYQNWCPGYPINTENNNCVAMNSIRGTGCWENTYCSDTIASVCGRFIPDNTTSIPAVELEDSFRFSLGFLNSPVAYCVRPWPAEWMCPGCKLVTAEEAGSNVKIVFGLKGGDLKELVPMGNYSGAGAICYHDHVVVGRAVLVPSCVGTTCYTYYYIYSNGVTSTAGNCNSGWQFDYANGDPYTMHCITRSSRTMSYSHASGGRIAPTASTWQWGPVESKTMTGPADYQIQFGRFWSTVADGHLTWFTMLDPSNTSLEISDFGATVITIPSTNWDDRGINGAQMYSTVIEGINHVYLTLITNRELYLFHATDMQTSFQRQIINIPYDINAADVFYINEETLSISAQAGTDVHVYTYKVTW